MKQMMLQKILLSQFSVPKPSFERIIETRRMMLKFEQKIWTINIADEKFNKKYKFLDDFEKLITDVNLIIDICNDNKCERQKILTKYEYIWILYEKVKKLSDRGLVENPESYIEILQISIKTIGEEIIEQAKTHAQSIINSSLELLNNIKLLIKIINGEKEKEELKEIFMAMQTEFSGTGHWYRCPNGHYYTIGDCGMAMQQSRCIECGAVIGGLNHQTHELNTHAQDFEVQNQS